MKKLLFLAAALLAASSVHAGRAVPIDSMDLNYAQKGGTPVIHPDYNLWVDSLRQAIDIALKTA